MNIECFHLRKSAESEDNPSLVAALAALYSLRSFAASSIVAQAFLPASSSVIRVDPHHLRTKSFFLTLVLADVYRGNGLV
jgi:hypothetical protein